MSSKNPVALWLDSFLGTPVAKSTAGGSGLAPAAAGGAAPAVAGSEEATGRSYFDNSVAAYALGLGLCFGVNFISRSGQPGGSGFAV